MFLKDDLRPKKQVRQAPRAKLWKLADRASARISQVMALRPLGEEIQIERSKRAAVGPTARGAYAAEMAISRHTGELESEDANCDDEEPVVNRRGITTGTADLRLFGL